MLIGLRNRKTEELIYKDMLDIDFDMSISEKNSRYTIRINRTYNYKDDFATKREAEDMMESVAEARNHIEEVITNGN